MKVRELRQALQTVDGNLDIGIVISSRRAYFDTPTVGIQWAVKGFDKDKGKFLITPVRKLMVSDIPAEEEGSVGG